MRMIKFCFLAVVMSVVPACGNQLVEFGDLDGGDAGKDGGTSDGGAGVAGVRAFAGACSVSTRHESCRAPAVHTAQCSADNAPGSASN